MAVSIARQQLHRISLNLPETRKELSAVRRNSIPDPMALASVLERMLEDMASICHASQLIAIEQDAIRESKSPTQLRFVVLKRGCRGDGSLFYNVHSELLTEQPQAAEVLQAARRKNAEAGACHTYAIMTIELPQDWEFA